MKENPAKNCRKVEVNDAKKKSALSSEEYKSFMAIAEKKCPHYYPIYYTFIHTGLRFTEFIKLKWPGIDFENKVLWIRNQNVRRSRTLSVCTIAS